MSVRKFPPSARISAALIAICFSFACTAHSPELVLAGGALRLCSSLSLKQCVDGKGPEGRRESTYSLSSVKRKKALSAVKPILEHAVTNRLNGELSRARQALGSQPVTARSLDDALWQACRGSRCGWRQMDDDQRAALLAALELGQFDAEGKRMPERVSLDASRDPSGPAILRHFVSRAALRSKTQRPRIALVTASGFDPYDAVDFYLGALAQAGAEPVWWPIDAALARSVFSDAGCSQLDALHGELLGLPNRTWVFPDRVSEQKAWCESEQAGSLPDNIQGIFFAGGDQWKLRRAFFDAQDHPNPWLIEMRKKHAAGELVVAGTSAGTAVQSGPGMLSNGSPQMALREGPKPVVPPTPGCSRREGCHGLDEQAFTVWPGGGFGLAGPFLMDTHFAERAREWRLMRALAQGPAKAGLGVDETSALHMIQHQDQSWTLAALGRSGGWLFDTESTQCGMWKGQASYLAAGSAVRWNGGEIQPESAVSIESPVPPHHDETASSMSSDGSFGEAAIRLALEPLSSGARRWAWRAEGATLSLQRSEKTEHTLAPPRPPSVLRLNAELSFPGDCGGD